MKMTLETITPERARELLKNNTRNRKVRESHVEYLANEMAQGRWVVSPAAIALSPDGVLVDGQHRLIAALQAGATIQQWVAYDVPMQVQDVIDGGAGRSVADQLHLSDDLPNANVRVGAARAVVSVAVYYQNYKLSIHSVRFVLGQFGDQIEYVISAVREFRPGMKTWLIGTLAFALAAEPGLAGFVKQVGSGVDLKKGDPAKTLRDWLTNAENQRLKSSYRRNAIECVLNAAYNAHHGAQLTQLRKGALGADYFCGKHRKFISAIREQLKHQI